MSITQLEVVRDEFVDRPQASLMIIAKQMGEHMLVAKQASRAWIAVTSLSVLLIAPVPHANANQRPGESREEFEARYNECINKYVRQRGFVFDYEASECWGNGYTDQDSSTQPSAKARPRDVQTQQEKQDSANSIKNCTSVYQKFKETGRLNGLGWNDFRKVCGRYYDPGNPKDSERAIAKAIGVPTDEPGKASPTPKLASRKQKQERKGMDIDPRTQEPCVQMTMMSGFPKKLRILGGKTAVQYKYKVTNTCQKGYTVVPQTNAGWEGLAMVGPNRSITWFCTDGNPANKDCKGGIRGYTFK